MTAFRFETFLPADYDELEPAVTIIAECSPARRPESTDPADSGEAGECRLLSVILDEDINILGSLPDSVLTRLEQQTWKEFNQWCE